MNVKDLRFNLRIMGNHKKNVKSKSNVMTFIF